jgi:hypothetical protein
MMTTRTLTGLVALVPFALLAACGGEDAAETDPETQAAEAPSAEAGAHDTAAEAATVRILSPEPGETVDGPDVRVVLEIGGMEIRPAGDPTPHSGHHHLYLDHDLTDPTLPVPTIPGQVIHMGDGSSEFTFQGVEAGEHRIIAVVGDFAHVPLQPWVVDTVFFTVR